MKINCKMNDGTEFEVFYRKGQPINADKVRAAEFKTESMILKAGTVRRIGTKPLSCDIMFEKDQPVTLRDGTVIYVDIFRPVDEDKHAAIVAWSPYGKEVGGQILDDIPNRAGIPLNTTSGLEKFEAPDPDYWVAHGYVIINVDTRGSYHSQGNLNYWGSENSRDGYDTIEWVALQKWSNGKVGMSGNSWLAVSQWFIAAEKPPHLAAIAPWEGFVDHFRESSNRGGIPSPVFPEVIFETFTSQNYIEDQPRMIVEYQLMNSYWQDKIAKLENITIPAYVVASYTNPIHTHGTFDGFRKIKSTKKWLRVHNTQEWFDYYQPENVEELRKFFDHYLNDVDNDWESTPRIRISILDPGHQDIVNRVENEFPLSRQQLTKLYLHSDQTLSTVADKSIVTYNTESLDGITFTYTFDKDTEIIGYMNLYLEVEADGSDDMELAVTVEKLTDSAEPIQSTGFLRVSQREIDETLSTESEPFYTHTHEDLLRPHEVVPIQIALLPIAMKYHAGEKLKLKIYPFQHPSRNFVPSFGSAQIELPKNAYTFNPDEQVEMKILGGNADFVSNPDEVVKPQKTRNHGKHIFHLSEKSFLLVPIV